MRRLRSALAPVALLITVSPIGIAAQNTGSISGQILDALTREPIRDVSVSVLGSALSSGTDKEGYYTIDGVTPGMIKVKAQIVGYIPITTDYYTVYPDSSTLVDFHLAPVVVRNAAADVLRRNEGREEHQSEQAAQAKAIQPGFGLGFSVGIDGGTSQTINISAGYEGFFRYGTQFGLFLLGGVHVSNHGIEEANQDYRLTSVFVEPRFVALNIFSRWAPFVTGRLGLAREEVDRSGVRLVASGYSLSGGVGAAYRLASQVALEAGLSFGLAVFEDYVFQGEEYWYLCLQDLESGTTLPESVIRCTNSARFAQNSCYPPFYDRKGGDCTPPKIPYSESGRSATWYQIRLGVHLSLSTP